MTKKRFLGLISVLVSAGLVFWLLSRVDREQVVTLWQHSSKGYLWLAMALTTLTPVLGTLRWLGVLRAQGGVRLPFTVAIRAVLMANVLNSFLPSKGGDVVKAAYLRQHGGLTLGFGSVVLERLIDLLVLGFLGFVGYLFSGVGWGLLAGGVLVGGVVGVFFLALWLPLDRLPLPDGIRMKAYELSKVFRLWVHSPEAMAQTLFCSFGVWSAAALTVCCLVSAFDLSLDWSVAYALFPLCVMAGLVPVTVSGVGTRDAVFVKLMMLNGVGLEGATMVALGYTVFAYWLLSLLCLPAVGWQLAAWRRAASLAENHQD
jgi:uncharacterized membrane protein YbhN (UPF0104 family)